MARLHLLIVLAAALLCSACGHTLVLANARVTPPAATAQLGPKPARFYIDRVKVPCLDDYHIGKRKSLAGRFIGWITSKDDLAAWTAREWRTFLVRHHQGVVSAPSNAFYILQSELTDISVQKKYDAGWNDDFSAHIECTIRVKERVGDKVVCSQHIIGDYFCERAYDDNDTISDDEMYNRCLSAAAQKMFEQVVFRDIKPPKPVNFFPSVKPF